MQNRLLSKVGTDGSTSYTYDVAGNLVTKTAPDGTTTYTYNGQNKLVKGEKSDGESSSYTYNALGVRTKNVQIRTNVNKGHANSDLIDGSDGTDYLPFLVDGRVKTQPTYEDEVGLVHQNNFETVTLHYTTDYLSNANRDIMVTADGQYVQRNVYDNDGTQVSTELSYAANTKAGESGENPASQIAADNMKKVWHRDSLLGSTLYAVDKNGSVISHTIYDAWGNPQTPTTTDTNFTGITNKNNYTGYTWDETLALYYAQNRFYDATTHRFTQQDTAKDGGNWYVYCEDNPTMRTDILGLEDSNLTFTIDNKTYGGAKIFDGALYAPIRSLIQAFGGSLSSNPTNAVNGDIFYTSIIKNTFGEDTLVNFYTKKNGVWKSQIVISGEGYGFGKTYVDFNDIKTDGGTNYMKIDQFCYLMEHYAGTGYKVATNNKPNPIRITPWDTHNLDQTWIEKIEYYQKNWCKENDTAQERSLQYIKDMRKSQLKTNQELDENGIVRSSITHNEVQFFEAYADWGRPDNIKLSGWYSLYDNGTLNLEHFSPAFTEDWGVDSHVERYDYSNDDYNIYYTLYIKSTMSPQDPAAPMLQTIYKIAYDKINDLYTMTGTIAIVKK